MKYTDAETVKQLREMTGMSQSEFSDHFEIPVKTYQNWEQGGRRIPEYLFRLLKLQLEAEQRKKDSLKEE